MSNALKLLTRLLCIAAISPHWLSADPGHLEQVADRVWFYSESHPIEMREFRRQGLDFSSLAKQLIAPTAMQFEHCLATEDAECLTRIFDWGWAREALVSRELAPPHSDAAIVKVWRDMLMRGNVDHRRLPGGRAWAARSMALRADTCWLIEPMWDFNEGRGPMFVMTFVAAGPERTRLSFQLLGQYLPVDRKILLAEWYGDDYDFSGQIDLHCPN